MSETFSNPWHNGPSPIDLYRRYKRRKAKSQASASVKTTDPRNETVNENRRYEGQTQQTAAAYQRHQERYVMKDPFASAKFPNAKQRPSGLWTPHDRPSDRYDPTDW